MATIAAKDHFTKQEFEEAFAAGSIGHYFQGIFDLTTKKVKYFEALARWNHPTLGLVNAARFVQDLEHHGFIAQLTAVAVNSIRQYYELVTRQNMIALPVSINVTASEFEAPDYVNYFCNLVEKAGIPFDLVNIEMLEWGQANDVILIGQVVKDLNARGIKVFADDFGHAYGSFHRMMNIPYAGIKLDCEYARAIETRLEAQVIIESMAKFSERLLISFVVEGIETLEQASSLKALGVQTGQGYLFNKPMPWLEAYRYLEPNLLVSK